MASDITYAKLALTGLEGLLTVRVVGSWSFRDGRGTAMYQRTFKASAAAFVLGLVISLVWSFLHA